jgi:hypothetical protein
MRILSIAGVTLLSSALSAANAQQQIGAAQPAPATKNTTLQKGYSGPRAKHQNLVSGGSDTCATATGILGGGPFLGDNLGATLDGPSNCGLLNNDVWYDWTAPSTGITTLSMCNPGTNYDTVVSVYDTSACTGALLTCNDDFCPGFISQTTFSATATNVYKIQIGGFNGAQGNYEMTLSVGPPPPPPGADNCAAPDPIAGLGVFPFNNSVATTGAEGQAEGICLFFGTMGIDNDIWYDWTSPSDGTVTVSLCAQTTMDSKFAVYNGPGCPTGAALACNDDAGCAPNGLASRLSFVAVNGGVYTFQLGNFPGAAGDIGTFTITKAAPPGDCDVYDDGATENSVGLTNGGEVLWMHRQGVAGGSTVVKSISSAWGSAAFPGSSPPNGTPARVGIWQDTDNNGDPSNGLVLLQVVNTTVQNVDTDTLNVTNLSPSVSVSGVYFIGAGVAHAAGQFPAPLDQTNPSGGRAWIVGDTTPPLDYNNLNSGGVGPFEMDAIGLSGIWLLRGDCKDIAITAMCFGDGTEGPCPCANPPGAAGSGCSNSFNAAGAQLGGSGNPIVSADTLSLSVTGMRPSSLCIFIQGSAEVSTTAYGDGLRCFGGNMLRLFKFKPNIGSATVPSAGSIPPSTSVSARAAQLGFPIVNGTYIYQVWYRDPLTYGCPFPDTFNVSNGARVLWSL